MLLKLKRSLVALDVETTGLNSTRDRIVEIGIIKVKPDGQTKEWTTLINPGIQIPEEVIRIHGITNEMVKNELPFDGVATGLNNLLRDCDICGYNVDFDVRFLTAEFARARIHYKVGKLIDSLKIFQKREPKNLTAAVKFYLNETLPGAHRALPDAKATLRILEAQLEKYPDLPRSVDELVREKSNDKFVWQGNEMIMNFGKYEGTFLREVPQDYFKWMLTGGFNDKVKQFVSEILKGKYPKK